MKYVNSLNTVTKIVTTVSTLTVCALFSAQISVAQSLQIPISQQGRYANNVETPRKGASQQQVVNTFGQPLNTYGPVGEPPINRWDYSNFSVYFEYDKVIHSVLKYRGTSKK